MAEGTTLFKKGFNQNGDPFDADPALLVQFTSKMRSSSNPIIDFEDKIFMYGLIGGINDMQIILGPAVLGEAESARLAEYAARHRMLTENMHFRSCNLRLFITALSTIYFVLSGKMLTDTDLVFDRDRNFKDTPPAALIQTYMMDNAERGVRRYSYVEEKMILDKIRTGDLEGIRAMGEATSDSLYRMEEELGRVAVNKFKHFEYIACAGITLYARAAIEGGMDAISAYALSDIYMQRLEKCEKITEMIELCQESYLEFAGRVRKILDKNKRSSYVEKSKSFIANHLNKSFSLDDVAKDAGVSRPYLSKRFLQEEGVGVMEYARNKRIEAAANMLRYSDEELSTIANYLCFNSQSHFGAAFKKKMGVTPLRYREMHKLIDSQPIHREG